MTASRSSATETDTVPALVLDRADVDALLYALDDADEFFTGGERADRMLDLWQRLNHARCYRDGEQGYHGDEDSRSFAISSDEALNLWLLCSPRWLFTITPRGVRGRVTAIVNRCRPSTRMAERRPN
jgi:hypothetical protein